jgi:hypothetical protein
MGKRIIISEREKNRISTLHTKKILMERSELQEQQSTPRYKNAVCPAGKVRCDQTTLRIQIRMNDECTSLTEKLIEDGILGPKTKEAWQMCKTKLTPTKTTQGGGGEKKVDVDGLETKTGGEGVITANDIATLTT